MHKMPLLPGKSQFTEEQEALLSMFLEKEGVATAEDVEQKPIIISRPDERYKPFPLTDIQLAYAIGRENAVLGMSDVSSHVYFELETRNLDVPRYQEAWRRLIERHDMMRCIILPNGQQQVLETVPPYDIRYFDLRDISEEDRQARIQDIRDELGQAVKAADAWPMFDVYVSRLDDATYRIHLSLEGLFGDVLSFRTMLHDIRVFYENPEARPAPLELTFRDYVLSLENRRQLSSYKKARAYWLERIPTLSPAPAMPVFAEQEIRRHRPKVQRFTTDIDRKRWTHLKEMGTQRGLSATSLLLAVFSEVLRRWNSEADFCLNLTLFNRLPLHPQIERIIGDFTDTLLLESKAYPDKTFEERAMLLRDRLWADLDNRQFGGMDVLRELNRYRSEREQQYMPVVFTSTFLMGDYNQVLTSMTLDGNPVEIVFSASQTPQLLIDHQVFEEDGRLRIFWDVRSEYFHPGFLDALFTAYTSLLTRLADDDSLWRQKEVVSLLPEQAAVRRCYNETSAPVPQGLLHTPFLQKARECPEAPAVVAQNGQLTYGELARRAAAVAQCLKGRVRPDELVAVVMTKGWEQIAAVLGILCAGGAYLPVDPGQPAERLSLILADGNVRTVLTQSSVAVSTVWPEGLAILTVDTLDEADPQCLYGASEADPHNLAYVIYTSGSTGAPKGVMIEHRAALNTIIDINNRFNIGPSDRTLALASLGFDLSVWDIFGTLAAGGIIVLPEASCEKEPAHWMDIVESQGITIWNTVPAMMQMLVEYRSSVHGVRDKGPIRLVLLSGDWLPVSLPEQIRNHFNAEVISLGGATEASIWSILYPVVESDPQWKNIPYGRPMNNQQFHVLNKFLQPCPDWVPGDLYIGGMGLARGYWNDTEKTERSFIRHPLTGERLYRTGDLGYFHPDGYLVLLGREDNQCKINGFRVELGEIEHALRDLEGIRESVVLSVREGARDHLVAYIEPDKGASRSLSALSRASSTERSDSWEYIVAFDNQLEKISADEVKDAAFYALSDALYEAGMQAMFSELGFFTSPGDISSIDDIIRHARISPRYAKWLARALNILCDQGFLTQEGDRFRSVKALEYTSVEKVRNAFEGSGVNDFMFQTALNLADLLREHTHSAELYASPEAKGLYPTMFKSSNRLIGNALKRLENEHRQGKMTVLEVGAGHGGTTQGLLPVLDGTKTHYLFTDISHYFLQNAQENFAAYDFVSYQLYNLDIPPETQGLEPHSFDAIVASSVLHDTRSIARTLHALLSLLKPGGFCFFVEQTVFLKCFDLGMGIQQGFDVFEDTDLRPHHPLLSASQWETCLRAAGYQNVHVFPKLDKNFVNLDIDVICAQAPDTLTVFDSSKIQESLAQRLPAYMLPARYIFLDSMPRNRSGKVDRKALPRPGSIQQDRRPYVAPRNDTEKILAGIWSEILSLDTPGIKDNFFELGGDSLLATVLIGKIHDAFQVELSVLDIYTTATLEEMARHINAPASASDNHILTTIQPEGKEVPWFCIPGAEGSLLTFTEMAQYLKPEVPLYGFRPVGLDGRASPLTRIEDMASHYINILRRRQPSGPYTLVGFCMGGFVAYEMAVQLAHEGVHVDRLVLVDSHLLPREVHADPVRSLCIYTGLFGVPMSLVKGVTADPHLGLLASITRDQAPPRQPVISLKELQDMHAEQRLGTMYTRIRQAGFLESMSEDMFRNGYAVLKANMDAMHAYTPPRWQGTIHFFRATDNPEGGQSALAYWKNSTSLHVTDVPGNHLTIMKGDAVRLIVNSIRTA